MITFNVVMLSIINVINTAIAKAYSPKDMAYAMKLAVMSGRLAYLAGKAQTIDFAQPSSPIIGLSK